jgi:hypothetical protein
MRVCYEQRIHCAGTRRGNRNTPSPIAYEPHNRHGNVKQQVGGLDSPPDACVEQVERCNGSPSSVVT